MAEASAPASSANLGPGFDTVALALEMRCRVVAEPSDTWSVRHHGPEAYDGTGRDAVLAVAQRVANDRPMSIDVYNTIPLARGLGSSSAAFAAGAMAAARAAGVPSTRDDIFPVVCELEGHPDNAAAAVFGGLVAVAGGTRMSLDIHPSLHVLIAVPPEPLSTAHARAVLSDDVERAAVVRSLGRIVALVEGLRTGSARVLAAARGDELHEDPRATIGPGVEKVIRVARAAGALHASWSGAGPSTIAFVRSEHVEAVREAMGGALSDAGQVIEPGIAVEGVI